MAVVIKRTILTVLSDAFLEINPTAKQSATRIPKHIIWYQPKTVGVSIVPCNQYTNFSKVFIKSPKLKNNVVTKALYSQNINLSIYYYF